MRKLDIKINESFNSGESRIFIKGPNDIIESIMSRLVEYFEIELMYADVIATDLETSIDFISKQTDIVNALRAALVDTHFKSKMGNQLN